MLGFSAALFLVSSVAAAPEPKGVQAFQFALTNGMQVLVIPDHRAPVVTQMLWFRVGGVDDPPGISGLAHFFEHMMFRGTKKVPGDLFSTTIAKNGGEDNAFTTHDFTAFFERIAKDRLPLAMQLEADRLAKEVVDRGQLGVAISEVRRSKALDLLAERAAVTDEAGHAVDVKAITAEAADDGEAGSGDADAAEDAAQPGATAGAEATDEAGAAGEAKAAAEEEAAGEAAATATTAATRKKAATGKKTAG